MKQCEKYNKEESLMEYEDEMELLFDAKSENENFARVVAAAFCARYNPTMEEIADVKTAVSEAVTNCIVHGYDNGIGKIHMHCYFKNHVITIEIKDYGIGIENIEQAMQPMYTSKPELERSGMGFSFMEAFMDDLQVISKKNVGTTVVMKKRFYVE